MQDPVEATGTTGEIALIGQMRRLDGYGFGLRQPGVGVTVRVLPVPSERLSLVEDLLRARMGLLPDEIPTHPNAEDETLRALLRWVRGCLTANAHPVLEDARLEARPGGVFNILQPCLNLEGCIGVIRIVVELLRWGANTAEASAQALDALFGARLDGLRERLRKHGVAGFNAIHFLGAAHASGVPWCYLTGHVFQFGYGSAARLLNSSITDRTSNIGVGWARSKPQAARLLRRAGLPVPPHAVASSAARAVSLARWLGYPVVVKPSDQDGGVGVSAGLRDAAAVERAYAAAAEHSSNILVEKHFEGRDYRVQVVEGEVQGILERVPGHVTGDGVHDIATLVERQNEERRTATDDRRHLHPIALDEEALGLLADLSMTTASVPEAGRPVRLRVAANVASGGTPVLVPNEVAHPDNLRLAARAARVLGLDVAGIDLLIPDIARSWFDTGAAICEVNAQPQMFTTMHRPMLQRMLGATGGRIPLIVVIGNDAGTARPGVAGAIHQALCAVLPSSALVAQSGLWLGDGRVGGPPDDLFDACRAMLIDRGVDALVLEVTGEAMLRRGWPIDRCDVLVIPAPAGDPNAMPASTLLSNGRFAARLRPARVLLGAGHPDVAAGARRFFGGRLTEVGAGASDELVRLAVLACRSRTPARA